MNFTRQVTTALPLGLEGGKAAAGSGREGRPRAERPGCRPDPARRLPGLFGDTLLQRRRNRGSRTSRRVPQVSSVSGGAAVGARLPRPLGKGGLAGISIGESEPHGEVEVQGTGSAWVSTRRKPGQGSEGRFPEDFGAGQPLGVQGTPNVGTPTSAETQGH